MIEVSATNHIVAGGIFPFHVLAKHKNLPFTDFIRIAIGRHMEREDHKLFPVFYRKAGNAVAAVKIKKFCD